MSALGIPKNAVSSCRGLAGEDTLPSPMLPSWSWPPRTTLKGSRRPICPPIARSSGLTRCSRAVIRWAPCWNSWRNRERRRSTFLKAAARSSRSVGSRSPVRRRGGRPGLRRLRPPCGHTCLGWARRQWRLLGSCRGLCSVNFTRIPCPSYYVVRFRLLLRVQPQTSVPCKGLTCRLREHFQASTPRRRLPWLGVL